MNNLIVYTQVINPMFYYKNIANRTWTSFFVNSSVFLILWSIAHALIIFDKLVKKLIRFKARGVKAREELKRRVVGSEIG